MRFGSTAKETLTMRHHDTDVSFTPSEQSMRCVTRSEDADPIRPSWLVMCPGMRFGPTAKGSMMTRHHDTELVSTPSEQSMRRVATRSEGADPIRPSYRALTDFSQPKTKQKGAIMEKIHVMLIAMTLGIMMPGCRSAKPVEAKPPILAVISSPDYGADFAAAHNDDLERKVAIARAAAADQDLAESARRVWTARLFDLLQANALMTSEELRRFERNYLLDKARRAVARVELNFVTP